jgi:hypothetical protein
MYELKIITDGKAITLDTFGEEELISLNYALADIRELDKKDTNYSKTITIPGTKNNDSIFEHIYEFGANTTGFNPNKKVLSQISVNSNIVFTGWMQLISIIDEGTRREYEVTIYGSLDNLYSAIEGLRIEDLDFSEYNHTYLKSNIKNSWDTSIIRNNYTIPFQLGRGYVYPLEDRGFTSTNFYDVEHFYPAIYVKEYLDKMFKVAGFTYKSDFFESDYFKKLIIPYSGSTIFLNWEQIQERLFRAHRDVDNYIWGGQQNNVDWGIGTQYPNILEQTSQSSSSGPQVTNNGEMFKVYRFTNDSTSPSFDNSNVYNTGTGIYTVNKTSLYKFKGLVRTKMEIIPGSGHTGYWFWRGQTIKIYVGIRNITTGVQVYQHIEDVVIPQAPVGNNNGYVGNIERIIEVPFEWESSGYILPNNQYRVEVEFTIRRNTSGEYALNTGGQSIGAFFKWYHLEGGYWFNEDNETPLVEGETMEMNQVVLKDVSCQDFFSSICRMFNLYVLDTEEERCLKIETRDYFFDSGGKTVNWTKKLDRSSEIIQEPMSELDFRKYIFTYKEDDDRFNKLYKEDYDRIYGDRIIEIDNDFRTEKKEIGIIFSPTPAVRYNSTNRYIPNYTKVNGDKIEHKPPKPRILFYGGVLDCSTWRFRSKTQSFDIMNKYPYTGHFDNPILPKEDLNFGVCLQYYYPNNLTTTANLYNRFWRRAIEEISDNDSKMLIGYFWLTPIDIMNFDYRDKIYIEQNVYRVNKIIDYHPSNKSLTKVELIKTKEGGDFTVRNISVVQQPVPIGTVTPVRIPVKDRGEVTIKPVKDSAIRQVDGNTFEKQNQTILVKGRENFVGAETESIMVSGKNNFIGNNSTNISIIGSDNVYIAPNVENVTVINSNDVVITESNVTYLNGFIQTPDYTVVSGGVDNVENMSLTEYQVYESTTDKVGFNVGLVVSDFVYKYEEPVEESPRFDVIEYWYAYNNELVWIGVNGDLSEVLGVDMTIGIGMFEPMIPTNYTQLRLNGVDIYNIYEVWIESEITYFKVSESMFETIPEPANEGDYIELLP